MRSRTLATLTLIALLTGCGDDPPGSVIQPDASGDVVGDGTAPPDGQPPPPDGAPMDDVPLPPPDMTPPPPDGAPPAETGVDATTDAVDMDVPTPPPDATPDVPVGMDMVTPPPDADGPDATPPDVAPDADGPDAVLPPDVPVMTGIAGHRATALVANGSVMRSPSFKLVSTLGQSSIHQTVMRSLGYRLRGGLVGATGGSR